MGHRYRCKVIKSKRYQPQQPDASLAAKGLVALTINSLSAGKFEVMDDL